MLRLCHFGKPVNKPDNLHPGIISKNEKRVKWLHKHAELFKETTLRVELFVINSAYKWYISKY